jgi:hypothetical protein
MADREGNMPVFDLKRIHTRVAPGKLPFSCIEGHIAIFEFEYEDEQRLEQCPGSKDQVRNLEFCPGHRAMTF